jgi:hypothetical protein
VLVYFSISIICFTAGFLYANENKTVDFTSSNLPIVVIDTEGQTIEDDSRVLVNMGIIYHEGGERNFLTDTFNDYDGKISIEIRGSTSQFFPKKQYRFETRDENDEKINVSLLGLPSENDWILYAPYSDKSLMRNVLAYKLFSDMGWYGSRTHFCELVLNGEYMGVYVLMEKIKRDDDRVDISELELNDNEGDALTGGYIIKIDKEGGQNTIGWFSKFPQNLSERNTIYYQYHYPDQLDITEPQKQYIQNYIYNFEKTVNSTHFNHPVHGYDKYINANSFIDYFITNELAKNPDGFRLSLYLHKDRDSENGRLTLGPVWDFNIAFGNNHFRQCQYIYGLIVFYASEHQRGETPFWWEKLLMDEKFANKTYNRWHQLRQDVLSTERIYRYIDSVAVYLDEAQQRNFNRWDILGKYIWGNYFIGQTYAEEVDYLKSWIRDRSEWLDNHIPGEATKANRDVVINEINYNSSPDFPVGDWLELHNMSDKRIDITYWYFHDNDNTNVFYFPFRTYIEPQDYVVICDDSIAFRTLFPQTSNLVGEMDFSFSNAGETIKLFDSFGNMIDTVRYDDKAPWPLSPDGTGATLELKNPAFDNAEGLNWAGSSSHGTPAAKNSRYGADTPPSFRRHSRFPKIPTSSDQAAVQIQVYEDQTIQSVTLKVDYGSGFVDIPMYDDGQHYDSLALDGYYGAYLPAVDNNTLVKYFIQAIDNRGQVAFYPSEAPDQIKWFRVDNGDLLRDVVIDEIMYNHADHDDIEYVELYNRGDFIDLSYWGIRDERNSNHFRFPDSVFLEKGDCLVICSDTTLIKEYYSIDNILGNLDFNLSNGGDQVRLFDANDVIVDSVEFDDEGEWPVEADGNGYSLELSNPDLDNSLPENWRASREIGGNPGIRDQKKLVIRQEPYNGGQVFPAAGEHYIDTGSIIELTARPADAYRFNSWSPEVQYPSSDVTTILMDKDKTVIAYFVKKNPFKIDDLRASLVNNSILLEWSDLSTTNVYDVYRDTTALFEPDISGLSNRIAQNIVDEDEAKDGIQWRDPESAAILSHRQNTYYRIVGVLQQSHLQKTTSVFNGTPHAAIGKIFNSDLSQPQDHSIAFTAFISSRPQEVLTHTSLGCTYENGYWTVAVGNFPSPWSIGDTLHLSVENVSNGESGTIRVVLSASGTDQADDLVLNKQLPYSNTAGIYHYSLITTDATNINEIAISLDTRYTRNPIRTAEELVQAIPFCSVVYKWDVNGQGTVGHPKGLPINNFSIAPGYPYIVNVDKDTVWALAGSIMDTTFQLKTTERTNINHFALPFIRSDLESAEEILLDVPHSTVIYQWVAREQGFIGHPKTLPINNFEVFPGMPYYINVNEESYWPYTIFDSKSLRKILANKENTQDHQRHVPHLVVGTLEFKNPDGEMVMFKAYMEKRPQEILTQSSFGCGLDLPYWWIQVAHFPSGWEAGEILIIEFYTENEFLFKFAVTLSNEGMDSVGEITASVADNRSPVESFAIFPNYPNPFNPATDIEYTLPRDVHVTLYIYDTLGRLVRVLVDEEKSAGHHRIRWDGRDKSGRQVSSGIYFCSMIAEAFRETKKMILTK